MDPQPIPLELTSFLRDLTTATAEKLMQDYFRIWKKTLQTADDLAKLRFDLIYLAEGNANVVYKLLFRSNDPSTLNTLDLDPHQRRCPFLLRIRKATSFGVPYQDVVNHYKTNVQPLFEPSDLVQQSLVQIPTSTLHALNDNLKALEQDGTRPAYRHGTYLVTSDPHALLMEDLSTSSIGPSSLTIELKPKWLIQSPSAPKSSLRCRTCALHAMRHYDAIKSGKKEPSPNSSSSSQPPCPLDLLSSSHATLRSLLAAHISKKPIGPNFDLDLDMLTIHLLNHPILTRLRAAQARHSAVRLRDFERRTYDPLALTLRDCTLFIRVRVPVRNLDLEPQGPDDNGGDLDVEVKLADLDAKSPAGGKLERWIETERRLIEEGWYEAKDVLGGDDEAGGEGRGGGELRLCDLGWGWSEEGDGDGVQKGEGEGTKGKKLKGIEVRELVDELI